MDSLGNTPLWIVIVEVCFAIWQKVVSLHVFVFSLIYHYLETGVNLQKAELFTGIWSVPFISLPFGNNTLFILPVGKGGDVFIL